MKIIVGMMLMLIIASPSSFAALTNTEEVSIRKVLALHSVEANLKAVQTAKSNAQSQCISDAQDLYDAQIDSLRLDLRIKKAELV